MRRACRSCCARRGCPSPPVRAPLTLILPLPLPLPLTVALALALALPLPLTLTRYARGGTRLWRRHYRCVLTRTLTLALTRALALALALPLPLAIALALTRWLERCMAARGAAVG